MLFSGSEKVSRSLHRKEADLSFGYVRRVNQFGNISWNGTVFDSNLQGSRKGSVDVLDHSGSQTRS